MLPTPAQRFSFIFNNFRRLNPSQTLQKENLLVNAVFQHSIRTFPLQFFIRATATRFLTFYEGFTEQEA